jgi:hypothetical protein
MLNGGEEMKIYLNGNTQARLEFTEPFLLPLNEFELEFCSDVYRLNTLIVSVKKEGKIKQFKVKHPFKLDLKEYLEAGAIDINVSMVVNTTSVKDWVVPTIYFKEIEHQFEITPEIAMLREQIDDNRRAIAELISILNNNNLI